MAENRKELFNEIAEISGLTYNEVANAFNVIDGHYDPERAMKVLAVLLSARQLGYTEEELDELIYGGSVK